jgi:cytoskeletal protein CcmA (bactofilin family)
MATQVQFRRGTTTQNNAFTGAIGEITYDTDIKTLRLHDGTNAGGGAVVATTTASQTLLNKVLSTGSSWEGGVIDLAYGGTGAALTADAGGIVYSTADAMGISSPGASGQVLTSGGTNAPTWVNASSLTVGTSTVATTASNIEGGSSGYLVYQVSEDNTGFIAPGQSGYILRSTGASTAPNWVTSALTIGSTALQVGDTETTFDGLDELNSTGTSHWTLPVGTTGERPGTPADGMVRYNTTLSSFEGYGPGSAWGSLGGVKDVDQDTYILAELSAGNDDDTLTMYAGGSEVATLNGTTFDITTTQVIINSTDSLQIPVGTTAQRDSSPAVGQIRYNSTLSSFEGYGPGSAWGSLGGVKDVDQDTYIIAETSAGNDDDTLTFYAGGTAIGTWNATQLDVNQTLNVDGNTTVGGNLTITGNLQVDGTTTTINSTTLEVDDLNITVASGAANAAAANGAGLTVDGASATINYASTGDKWTMNKPLDVTGSITSSAGITGTSLNVGTGAVTAGSLDISGNADIDGTMEADAYTVNGTTLAEYISDTVGAMVSSNTESGISVTYDDADNTLDFNVADPTITLTGAVTGSATMTNLGNVSITTTATSDPTLTLTGDASGSATFTNLGDATLTVTIANDSHTHDGRYFTETESDARFARLAIANTFTEQQTFEKGFINETPFNYVAMHVTTNTTLTALSGYQIKSGASSIIIDSGVTLTVASGAEVAIA